MNDIPLFNPVLEATQNSKAHGITPAMFSAQYTHFFVYCVSHGHWAAPTGVAALHYSRDVVIS